MCDTADQLPTEIAPTGRLLTAAEFHRLADVPPEVEWFANLSNPHTRRVYGVPVATEPRVRLGTPARRVTLIFRRKPTFDARRNIGRRKAESYGPVVHQLMHLS